MNIYCVRNKKEFFDRLTEVREDPNTINYFSIASKVGKYGKYYFIYQNPTQFYIEKYTLYKKNLREQIINRIKEIQNAKIQESS